MNDYRTNPARRNFLKTGLSLAAGVAVPPWMLNLAAIGEAAAAQPSDYKALVCVFLLGGNDYANTLVPFDAASHARYQALRPAFAYASASLQATALNPRRPLLDAQGAARQYALAPELAPLLPVFDSGEMAVLLNVGTLIQPTSKEQYLARAVPLPAKLFSHNDQQSEWQSSGAEGTSSGWGGRTEDLFLSANANPVFSSINVYSNAVFLSGETTTQYQVTSNGPVPLKAQNSAYGSSAVARTLRSLIGAPSSHYFEDDHAQITAQALGATELLSAALSTGPAIATPFPSGNSLADQLKMVARIASVAQTLGARRQVFFVALGGFDSHDTLGTSHPQLLTAVGGALAAFHEAAAEIGLSEQITAFTASDFGRTLTVNSEGSDHGWGSMHFVLGGAVKGGQFYGTPPAVADNGPDDVGQGRLLPSTSVDQLAATLGRWFGASDEQLLGILPNLANFDAGARNLGFV